MPIFDYQCVACGHVFEALQKVGAEPLVDCPECSKPELQKRLSAPNFHLKGKGWRNSDDTPKKPDVRPKFGHMLDSPTPHAEHHDHGDKHTPDPVAKAAASLQGKKDHNHSHDHGHSHKHTHDHGHSHGHSHSHDKKDKK